jgi:hypothetical protein
VLRGLEAGSAGEAGTVVTRRARLLLTWRESPAGDVRVTVPWPFACDAASLAETSADLKTVRRSLQDRDRTSPTGETRCELRGEDQWRRRSGASWFNRGDLDRCNPPLGLRTASIELQPFARRTFAHRFRCAAAILARASALSLRRLRFAPAAARNPRVPIGD